MSCTNPLNDKSIVGTWVITNLESKVNLSPVLIASVKEFAITKRYQINDDFKIGVKDTVNPFGYSGHWELDSIQKLISFSFEDSESKFEKVYKILEFNENMMKWHEDMGEFGQNIITLERCNECSFEIPTAFSVGESDLEKLDELVLSSTNYTNAYCACMEELKKRESCIEAYDKARFEIKVLADLAEEKYNVSNRIESSDNKFTIRVKELREKLVYCRNGLDDNTYNSYLYKNSSPPK